jgi:DNA-binding beta-propeller fold protein YncE
MDPNRFDAIARALDTRRSRRGALLGGVLGALGIAGLSPDLDAAGKHQRKRNRKQRRKSNRRCIDCADRALTRGADLRGCDLSGRDLSGADLRSADLDGACLQRADLTSADLNSADFENADVRGANFTDANLDRADIRGWKSAGAVFCRTTMPGGDLHTTNCLPGGGECIVVGDLCVPGIGDRCCGQGACTGGTCQCPAPLNDCGGVCRECCGDSDCGGDTPYCCDGICRGCCDTADCAEGQRCQARRCVCNVAACRAAGGCCVGNTCDLDAAQWSPETSFGQGDILAPRGVAISGDGKTVWLSDGGSSNIQVWTESGGGWRQETAFGNFGIGVAVSADGRTVWVVEQEQSRISVWTEASGVWSNETTFGGEGSDPDQFKFPGGIAVSKDAKTVWVADDFNHRISVWTESGGTWENQTTFGSEGSGPNQFSFPVDVAVSADGKTVWVAESGNDRISVWRLSGGSWSPDTTFGSSGSGADQFDTPQFLDVSADGRTVWVSDLRNDRVSVWTKSGGSWTNQTTFGRSGSGADRFDGPEGVAVAADGRTAWVADFGNERVSVWVRACPPA